jgi:hypothetical protein
LNLRPLVIRRERRAFVVRLLVLDHSCADLRECVEQAAEGFPLLARA